LYLIFEQFVRFSDKDTVDYKTQGQYISFNSNE